ncbi:MAG: pirin family protein, partial [Gammaproteobacteria bacterium]|nr:pirin family protein [Gammaproteobacteria bacterium]
MTQAPILETVPLDFQWPTLDPFLFCVHHYDAYPEGNEVMGPDAKFLSGRNIGSDFEPKNGWRMYHGDRVPGFPVHPHRGFETVTIVQDGIVDHADSMGAAGRYGAGDTQWMTAGKGVQHSEMFPLIHHDRVNTMQLFQIWINLPKKNKFVEPHFAMFWHEKTPRKVFEDDKGAKTQVQVVAGKLEDITPLAPPPESWAADNTNEVAIWVIDMEAHAKWT